MMASSSWISWSSSAAQTERRRTRQFWHTLRQPEASKQPLGTSAGSEERSSNSMATFPPGQRLTAPYAVRQARTMHGLCENVAAPFPRSDPLR
ncbi:MAG: hypothetical protein ACK56F_02830 [bacterium]